MPHATYRPGTAEDMVQGAEGAAAGQRDLRRVLVGGGNLPHPGEISLAHRGVHFLDELPGFGMRDLEVLRQPIEDKIITIGRDQGTLTFPVNFMPIGAMNRWACSSAERRSRDYLKMVKEEKGGMSSANIYQLQMRDFKCCECSWCRLYGQS